MAGTVMHLVIADRLMETFGIGNPGYFYCGNLAPDAIMAREGYTREMKRHTHFKDDIHLFEFRKPEKQMLYRKRLDEFVQNFLKKRTRQYEIYFGYLTHILVDELYILYFRDDFVDRLEAEGKSPNDEAFFRLFTHDVDLVDWELVRTYTFRYPMPEVLHLPEDYEIPGYITAKEIQDSKQFIIHKNFEENHPEEALKVMTLEKNQEFVELCVREIPRLMKERYGLEYSGHRCPCCGFYTLSEAGAYEICPVCYWEDDPVQENDPSLSGGANECSLLEGRENFRKYGACEERFARSVRAPLPEEMEYE